MPSKAGFETRAIHAGYEPDPTTGAVIPPIYATSTYKQDGVGGLRGGYEYSRSRQPHPDRARGRAGRGRGGRAGLRVRLRPGRRGHPGPGRCCRPGDHVVFPDDAYGGTYRLFDKVEQAWGVEHTPAAVSDVDAVRAAIRPGRTRLVWVETPTNPLLNIGDIEALAAVAHDAGALLVVDNTFASPYLQQPLTLGADVVRALHDQVRRRPLRRRRRRPRRARPRPRRAGRLPPERHRRRARPVRRVPDPPRPEDARRADGPPLRQRRGGRRLPHRPPGGHARSIYPGPRPSTPATRSRRAR